MIVDLDNFGYNFENGNSEDDLVPENDFGQSQGLLRLGTREFTFCACSARALDILDLGVGMLGVLAWMPTRPMLHSFGCLDGSNDIFRDDGR